MLKKIVVSHVNKNKNLYIIMAIFFIVGICLGVFCINNLNDSECEIAKLYLYEFKDKIVELENTEIKSLFFNSLVSKFKFIGIIFILSCTVIGGAFIYICVLYKGFSIGYVISSILKAYGIRKGILFALTTLAVQNFIYIPCIIFFSIYCINFDRKIKTNNVDIKRCFLKLFIVFFIIMMISTISSTFELAFSYKILKKIQKIF